MMSTIIGDFTEPPFRDRFRVAGQPKLSVHGRGTHHGRASVDFTADQPGPTLFHCRIQHHMDFGFKALLRYSGNTP
jgi:FtsP/CotA-like multicopper oxidase with cupredoxin domain